MIFRFTLSNDGRAAVNPNVGALNTAQQDGDGFAWTFDTVPDRWEVNPGISSSKRLIFEIVDGVANADYEIGYDFNVTDQRSIRIALWDEDFFQTVFSTVSMLTSGDYSGTRTLTPDFEPKYLTFIALASLSTPTVTVRTFTFSATNTPEPIAAESQIISEPDGWEDAILKLERHEDFHSLIEFFEGAFIFYGTNGVEDGGIDFIRLKEQQFGPDATINILIEIAIDDITFETLFTGQLDLSSKEELDDNTMQLGIIREDFWAKFINRLDTPVNLQDVKNLDGLPARFYDSVNLSLLPQRLNAQNRATQKEPNQVLMPGTAASYPYIQFDLWDVSLDEIEQKFNIPTAFNPERPGGLFELTYAGEYRFDIKYCLAIMFNDPSTDDDGIFNITGSWQFDIFIQFNDEQAIQFTQVNFGNNGGDPTATDRWSEFSYIGTHTRKAGDTVRVYADVTQILFFFPDAELIVLGDESGELDWTQLSGAAGPPFGPVESIDTHFNVFGDTEFPESNAEGFLIHDAAAHIADRIIGEDGTFYSEFLGSAETTARQYVSDGCGWFYSLIKGLQLRLYSLLEKPFFMSFKQWWEGANPILNLGLGYEIVTPEFNPSIGNVFHDATQSGDGVAWTTKFSPTRWEVTLIGGENSKLLMYEIEEGIGGATYSIGYDFTVNATTTLSIRLYNATLSQFISSDVSMPVSGDYSGTRNLIPNFTPRYLVFVIPFSGLGQTASVKQFTFVVTNIPDQTFQAIRVEEKSHFYDDSETSVDFSNVRRISKGYDVDNQFNLVEIGYKKWNADDVSGIDDPQTKRNYATIFKKIGKKLTLLSDWIAAGLTIEVTRRTTREKSADYQYDNDVFIVAINPVPVEISPETSPDVIDFEPEQEENFSSVTNLQNSDSRYNLRLTPARNLLRWMNFITGCLQSYLNSVFKFSSGEGNFDMISQMTDTSPACSDADFSGNFLSEKQDINVSGDYLFLPEPLEITEMPMEYEEYKLIVAKRKNPIGISQTSAGHIKCFIKSLEYKIVSGVADLVVWPKNQFTLQVVESLPDIGCNEPNIIVKPLHPLYLNVLNRSASEGVDVPSDFVRVKHSQLLYDLDEILNGTVIGDVPADLIYCFTNNVNELFCRYNWKSAANFKLAPTGLLTFTPDDAVNGDGSTGYYDTVYDFLVNGVHWTLGDAGFFCVVASDVAEDTGGMFGSQAAVSVVQSTIFNPRTVSNNAGLRINQDALSSFAVGNANSIGRYIGRRFVDVDNGNADTLEIVKNGISLGESTSFPKDDTLCNIDVSLFARNSNGTRDSFTSRKMRFLLIGDSMLGHDAELNQAWTDFETGYIA